MKVIVRGDVNCPKLRKIECQSCGLVTEGLFRNADLMPVCKRCGTQNQKPMFSMPTVTAFREGYYENSSEKGVHASTLAQLEEDCERSGNRVEDRGEIHYAKHRQRWT